MDEESNTPNGVVSPRRTATLREVSERAGVSTATVARVLHNSGYVAPDTRSKVEAAIGATGYSLNAIARGLRTQRTRTLGHVLSSISYNPLFAGISLGVDQEALERGYNLFLMNVENDVDRERKAVTRLIESRVDAVIFTHASAVENVHLALDAGIPVVQVERLVDAPSHAVLVDNTVGCRAAMEHLIGLGHRRIAFVGADPARYDHAGPRSQSIEAERLHSYRGSLEKAGIPVDPALIALGTYHWMETADATGIGFPQHQFDELLAMRDHPTALLVTGGMLVVRVLQTLYARGLRVPDDISVIGYDDATAPMLAPPLSAVALPVLELGRVACELAIAGGLGPPQYRTLATQFHLRQSTGPVSKHRKRI